MNYQTILEEIYKESQEFVLKGIIADSIPEFAKVDPNKFGIHLIAIDEKEFFIGDSNEKFFRILINLK
jgi:glutaminase